jgi:hypothetical protein
MSDVMLRTDATVYWFNIFEMVATVEDLLIMKRKYPARCEAAASKLYLFKALRYPK